MNLRRFLLCTSLAASVFILVCSQAIASEGDPYSVFFKNLTDGQVVGTEVSVQMGTRGVVVEKAGEVKANHGHHHILIDTEPVEKGGIIGKDDKHLHFGAGETEATLHLSPGKHTLTLQFADGVHRSYGPGFSSTITVEVKGDTPRT